MGPQGAKGDTGADGAVGPQGLKGDKGDKGDTGAAGKDGVSGYSRVTKAVLVGTNTAVSASCNTGSKVLGGGISGNNVNLSVSYPSADDTWTVVASKTNGQNTVSATVYAICQTVN